MVEVFSESRGSEATDALRGAEMMVATIDHVLELLGAPMNPDAEGQTEPVRSLVEAPENVERPSRRPPDR
jgi:hypothetical protein